MYNSFLCLCLEDLWLSPLISIYKTKLYFVFLYFFSMHPSCSTCNSISFSNGTHTLATSTYFTAKGSWEKILNIPIPSSRIFFPSLFMYQDRELHDCRAFLLLRGQWKCQSQTNWKKHSLSEQALLSLLRSKHVIPAASPSSVPLNSKVFRTLASIRRERACHSLFHYSRKRYGQSFH